MHSALYVSKTGLSAQDKQLTTIANNLANAATVGFKRDRAVFEDLLYQIQRQPGAQSTQETQLPSGLQLGVGTRVAGTTKQFTEGSLQITEQPLDLAIDGRGFLPILQPDGTNAYTRNGQLHLNAEGQMVNADGLLLQPAITVPNNATSVTIGTDGTVSAMVPGSITPQNLGNIQVVDFVNPAGLQSLGGNLYVQTGSSGDPVTGTPGENGLGRIQQGSLENSNVNIVEEMVNMITSQRAYEMNSKVIKTADEMLQNITQNL